MYISAEGADVPSRATRWSRYMREAHIPATSDIKFEFARHKNITITMITLIAIIALVMFFAAFNRIHAIGLPTKMCTNVCDSYQTTQFVYNGEIFEDIIPSFGVIEVDGVRAFFGNIHHLTFEHDLDFQHAYFAHITSLVTIPDEYDTIHYGHIRDGRLMWATGDLGATIERGTPVTMKEIAN